MKSIDLTRTNPHGDKCTLRVYEDNTVSIILDFNDGIYNEVQLDAYNTHFIQTMISSVPPVIEKGLRNE